MYVQCTLRYGVVLALIPFIAMKVECQTPTAVWRLSEQPQLSLGARQGTNEQTFGRIAGAVRLSTGEIFVADWRTLEVRLFSTSGQLLNTAGQFGAGPGDFRTIKSVRLCGGDSAFVYDPSLRRISVYAPNGTYTRAIDVRGWSVEGAPPHDFWCNPTGVLSILHQSAAKPTGIGPRRPPVAITTVDRKGIVVRLGQFPGPERYFEGRTDIPRPFGKQTSAVMSSNAIFVGTGDGFDILKFALNGTLLGSVHTIKRAQVPIRSEDIHRFIEIQVARRPGQRGREARAGFGALEYPKVFPPYAALVIDVLNNLWVESFPVPGREREWTVYSDSGVPVAQLRVDAAYQILEAGRDYVLGIWRDELEVEYVRVYKLQK